MEEIINKVFNEDCLVGMNRIPDKSIDCIICDLPYGKLKHLGWDNIIPFDKLWEQYNRIAKDNAAVLLFGVEPFTSFMILSNLNEFRQKLTWAKSRPTNVMNAKKQFMNWTEDIIVFYRSLPTFNPQMVYKNQPPIKNSFSEVHSTHGGAMGKGGWHEGYVSYNNGYAYPKSVLEFGSSCGWLNKQPKYYHPTQKPVDLIRYLIRTYTNSGDIVLDNCMGSGTTAIAALREGRKYVGFELDKKYYEMIQQRIAEEKDYIELTDNKLF